MGDLRGVILALLLAGILCVACSGGGSVPDTKYLAGRAAAGDAPIWLDLDGDWVMDPEEPQGRTSESGNYSLPLAGKAPDTAALVVRVAAGESQTADGRRAGNSYLLAAPAGSKVVSVWATLAAGVLAGGGAADLAGARAQVRDAFGLPREFDFNAGQSADSANGLEQIVQLTYGQRFQADSASDTAPGAALITAAGEMVASSSQILALADRFAATPAAPPPGNSQPVAAGTFHGDFAAMPVSASMAYGIGLDEASRSLKNNCTTVAADPAYGLCANTTQYAFNLVQSENELSTYYSIGASAKAGVHVAGFDVVSASGEFRFLKETKFADDALYILFHEEQRLCGYEVKPAMTQVWGDKFANDYEGFRQVCGDRYLSSVTTGGMFSGLVEVTRKDNETFEEMRLSLSAKVLGSTVYKKNWKDTLREIADERTTRTRVVGSHVLYSDNFLTMEEVLKSYNEFVDMMGSGQCSGIDGWQNCAYLATFSPYETIAAIQPGNGAAKARLANMQALEGYYFEMNDLIGRLGEMIAHPDDYNIGDRVDAFSQPNAWTVAELQAWQTEKLPDYRAAAVEQWDRCYADLLSCDKDLAALALPSWRELQKELPTRKFVLPETCAMVAELFGYTADDKYTVYFGGQMDKAYPVLCREMAASSPKTYLPLANTSGNVTAPTYNYSSLHHLESGGSEAAVIRTFTALLVETCPAATPGKRCLQVIPGQKAYTAWGAAPAPATDVQKQMAESLVVLEARGQNGTRATANLDLTGTGFILSPDLVIEGSGEPSNLTSTVSSDRKWMETGVTGGTAAAPLKRIILEWDDQQ